MFVVEHSVGEGLFHEGADSSGDTEGELVDGLQGLFIEQGFFCSCQFEVVDDVEFCLIRGECGHMVAGGDSLVQGFRDGEFQDSSQVGLSGEDEDEGVVGIHLEVGE